LGTARDIGKTVTSIGIIAKLLSPEHGFTPGDIGYMTPVGQQTLTVLNGEGVPIQADKDAVLLTSLMSIDCHGYEKVSPVVWAGGVTADFIDQAAKGDPLQGREEFLQRIRDAYQHVALGKRVVIVEGTGQPGVGSVAGISNADVINALREMGVPVFVVMVTEGGIGSTIDEIFPYLMAMDHMGTRVDGLIINSVLVSKIDKIHHYLHSYYTKTFSALYGSRLTAQSVPPILGYVPLIHELKLPVCVLIAEHFAHEKDSALEVVCAGGFR
jgi:dethiobiotin synthetase